MIIHWENSQVFPFAKYNFFSLFGFVSKPCIYMHVIIHCENSQVFPFAKCIFFSPYFALLPNDVFLHASDNTVQGQKLLYKFLIFSSLFLLLSLRFCILYTRCHSSSVTIQYTLRRTWKKIRITVYVFHSQKSNCAAWITISIFIHLWGRAVSFLGIFFLIVGTVSLQCTYHLRFPCR